MYSRLFYVIIADATSVQAPPLFKYAKSFLAYLAPLRIGIVPSITEDETPTGKTDASVAIAHGTT